LFLTYYLQQTLAYSPMITGVAFLPISGGLVVAANTGTFGVAPQDAGVASATVTVGQQLGASVGTAVLNTIFAGAVTSYLGRHALAGLALSHGYDTAFWWIAGIFAAGAVVGGVLLRSGPLGNKRTPSPAQAEVVP
jgi:hypothetical protein